jgi:putative tricarboxylic transport membrane protein
VFDLLTNAVSNAFTIPILLYVTLGVLVGVTVGAIPGLSGDMAIAILIPLIYKVDPSCALGLLIGIYKGSMFGGSISAISFGVPGTAAAAATVEDGYPCKQKGKPKSAMLQALYSSVTGDFFGTIILIFLTIPIANAALQFGPIEFFALYVFSMTLVALLTRNNASKGIASAAIGLLIGAVGMDPVTGSARLTFGIDVLRGGIPLIPLLVGIFALPELIIQYSKEWKKVKGKEFDAARQNAAFEDYDASKDKYRLKDYIATFKATLIGTGVGTFVGALPGPGSSLAGYMSYGLSRRFSKTPEEFGKGTLEGIAGPEAGNSATCGGSIIPLFAFGIPGTATAALIGSALIMMGINPGPTMISENKVIIYTFFVTIFYATFINLGLSKLLIPMYARLAMIQTRYLVPAVFVLALLGTYAANNSVTDIYIVLIACLLGVILRKYDFSLGSLVLGFIIGPNAERSLRQALLLGHGNWGSLFSTPIAIGLYVAALVFMILIKLTFNKKPQTAKEAK